MNQMKFGMIGVARLGTVLDVAQGWGRFSKLRKVGDGSQSCKITC